tara:strand:- start:444 stop:1040 length:597 start_codon:yes stop_codon:yes gene_type:complete
MGEIVFDKGAGYVLAAVISAVTTLGAVWFRHYLYEKKQDISPHNRSNENIYLILQKLIEDFGADRAYIYEFHNGERFFSGQPQKKFSCTYEWTGEGISAESNRSQNYRVTNFHQYIKTLLSDGKFFRNDAEGIRDFSFRALLQDKGVKSLYNIPIRSITGKNIGFVGIDYVKEKKTLSGADQSEFAARVREVAAFLSN